MFEEYKDIVTFSDLQKMLHIRRNKAYQLLSSGKIKARKTNGKTGKYIIPKYSVIEYVESKNS